MLSQSLPGSPRPLQTISCRDAIQFNISEYYLKVLFLDILEDLICFDISTQEWVVIMIGSPPYIIQAVEPYKGVSSLFPDFKAILFAAVILYTSRPTTHFAMISDTL